MPKKIDLTGKTFDRLQVIKQAENIQTPNGRSHVAWECLCECGKTIGGTRSINICKKQTAQEA